MSEVDIDTIFILASDPNYDNFAECLGDGLGHNFPSLTPRLQEKILTIANENSNFAKGLGSGFDYSFKYLNSDTKKLIIKFGLYDNADLD